MAQQLKRWESPRRSGRNHKGRGGSARHRQRQQQLKLWRKRLQGEGMGSEGRSKARQAEPTHGSLILPRDCRLPVPSG
jgi:hypothetical protein